MVCFASMEPEQSLELLKLWTRCESDTFCALHPEREGSIWSADTPNDGITHSLPAHARARVVVSVRSLLSSLDALQELQSVLTLLDFLASRGWTADVPGMPEDFQPSYFAFTEPAAVAAAVRLVLKTSGYVFLDVGIFRQIETHFGFGHHFQDSATVLDQITQLEVRILDATNFRVGLPTLPSPIHWAAALLRRLAEVKGGGDEVGAEPVLTEETRRSVSSWAELLVERVRMTPETPPRTLALGAVTLGLVTTGSMDAAEVRPEGLSHARWRASLLAAQSAPDTAGTGCGAGTVPRLPLDARDLAEAAGCGMEELRRQAFAAVQALQDSLFR